MSTAATIDALSPEDAAEQSPRKMRPSRYSPLTGTSVRGSICSPRAWIGGARRRPSHGRSRYGI